MNPVRSLGDLGTDNAWMDALHSATIAGAAELLQSITVALPHSTCGESRFFGELQPTLHGHEPDLEGS